MFSSRLYTLEPSLSGGFWGSHFAALGGFVAVNISYRVELIWRPTLCCISWSWLSSRSAQPLCLLNHLASRPCLSLSGYSRKSRLLGEATAEMKPLEMAGWYFIRPGGDGFVLWWENVPGGGTVWDDTPLALEGRYHEPGLGEVTGRLGHPLPPPAPFLMESSPWLWGPLTSNPGLTACELGDSRLFHLSESVLLVCKMW